jgi:hypothetical protein
MLRVYKLFALEYNLANVLRQLVLPMPVRDWTLRDKLASQERGQGCVACVIFQLAEVAVPRKLFAAILTRIGRLRLACDSG